MSYSPANPHTDLHFTLKVLEIIRSGESKADTLGGAAESNLHETDDFFVVRLFSGNAFFERQWVPQMCRSAAYGTAC
jgi:hypothetical protein